MEESTSTASATMIKLTSSNYSIWKPKMDEILYCKDLYQPLQNEGKKPEAKFEAN